MIRARAALRLLAALGLATLAAVSAARAAGPEGALRDGQVLRGRFVQERHLQGFKAPLRSGGHFVLAAGKGLLWRAETPFAVTTAISPAGLSQEVDGSRTLDMPAARLPFLRRLYAMLGGALGGDWSALQKDFTVTRSGDARHWRVLLTPRRAPDPATLPFRAITALGGRFVDSVRIDKADGDHDDLRFLDQSLDGGPLTAAERTALAAAGT